MHGGYSAAGGRRRGGRPAGAGRRCGCAGSGAEASGRARRARSPSRPAGFTSRYRRRSVPLTAGAGRVRVELAGRAAARLAGLLGVAVHPSTVLRLLAALPERQLTAAPEVLGIDDFALRKGQVYGTVLVDIGTSEVVDLLPDREATTLEAWLTAHPGTEVICRDRAGAYAEGARNGAPGATQVADRWHLWHNLAGHAEKTVARHRACLTEPSAGGTASPPGTAEQEAAEHAQEEAGPAIPDGPADRCGTEGRLVARTRERYAAVHELLQAGESLHAISRAAVAESRPTVRRFARAASAGELLRRGHRQGAEAGPVQGLHSPAMERRPHRRRRTPRRAARTRLHRQRADRPPVRGPVPAGHRRARPRAGGAQDPGYYPLAALPPRTPQARRTGTAQRHPFTRRTSTPSPGTSPASPR